MALSDLPSAEAANRLVRGDAKAIVPVAGTMILRAGLIAAGLYLVGNKERIVPGALAGAAAIEAFVLAWAWSHRENQL